MAIPMLGERVGIRRGLAVLVGLGGVIIVLQPGATEFGLGHLAALIAAVCGGFGSVIVRKIGHEERSVVLILYPRMMANVVVMGAALPFVYQPMPGQDMAALAVIAGFALIATTLLIFAYRLAPAGHRSRRCSIPRSSGPRFYRRDLLRRGAGMGDGDRHRP